MMLPAIPYIIILLCFGAMCGFFCYKSGYYNGFMMCKEYVQRVAEYNRKIKEELKKEQQNDPET